MTNQNDVAVIDNVTELHHRIADEIETYMDAYPGFAASVVLAALGEALVNMGVRQMGYDYTIDLCRQLQRAVEQARH